MPTLELRPTHKVVASYYDNLATFEKLGITHEGAVRSAFQELLESCARQFDWKLVPEFRAKAKAGNQIAVDGGMLDNYGLVHGYWEAKDGADDLDKEIKHKFSIGYRRRSTCWFFSTIFSSIVEHDRLTRGNNRAFQKEAQIMKERGKKALAPIPLNLDGFLFSDDYQSGKKSEIKSRVSANFVGWEKDHAPFDRELGKVIRALRTDEAGREKPPLSKL